MRALGLIGLLLALAIVGVLAAKQLKPSVRPLPVVEGAGPGAPAAQTPQQVQQQIKQQVDTLMQQPRPMPEDVK